MTKNPERTSSEVYRTPTTEPQIPEEKEPLRILAAPGPLTLSETNQETIRTRIVVIILILAITVEFLF